MPEYKIYIIIEKDGEEKERFDAAKWKDEDSALKFAEDLQDEASKMLVFENTGFPDE